MTSLSGSGYFNEVDLMADLDGKEDLTADHSIKVKDFGSMPIGWLLTRTAIMRRGIKDPQCGYTAISVPTLKALLRLPFCNGYGYPNEILCNLAILRTRIIEVPVRAVYGEEASGIWIPSYAVKMLFILTRCFFRRLTYLLGIFTVQRGLGFLDS